MFFAAVETAPEDPMPGGQFVLLAEGSGKAVDVRCWSVTSEATQTTTYVAADGLLEPGAALRLYPETSAIASDDRLTLADGAGRRVDQTPRLIDHKGDDRFWYRTPDRTWSFGRQLAFPDEVSDGQLIEDAGTC